MGNSVKYGVFLIVTLSLMTLNVFALSESSKENIKLANNSSEDSTKPTNDVNEPTTIGVNVDFTYHSHEGLSNYSDTILIGTVKDILPSRWNTIDGRQPNKTLTDLIPGVDIIYTDIIISVGKYLKNPLASQEVIVRVINGTVGNVSMKSDAEPKFDTGERVLLYLSQDTNPSTKNIGSEHFVVTDFYKGKFTLTDGGKAIGFDENTTLNELLSTINQTENKTNDNGIAKTTGTVSKDKANLNSTPNSKIAPFPSSIWVLAIIFGAFMYLRKTD
jgi:hypothetical protein